MKHLRTLAAAAGGAAALTLAAPADAAAPTRIDAEYWGISCVTALPGGNTLFLFGGGTTDGSEGGVGGFVEDADGALVAEGQAERYAFGASFSTGISLGAHRFTLDARAVRGAAEVEVINERDGNKWTKGTVTHTEVALTPTSATYDGAPVAVDPGACEGDLNAFRTRSNNPGTQIRKESDFNSDICDIDGLTDGQVRISGALPTPYVEVVLDHGGEDVEKLQGELRLRANRGTLSTDVRDVFTGEVRTTASVGLALTQSGRSVRTTESADGVVERRTVTPYRQTITLRFADGRRGTATCAGVAVDTVTRIKAPR